MTSPFKNNFSAAGGNTSVVIEEASVRDAVQGTDPRSSHLITVSAKTKVSLKGNLERLIAYLDANPTVSLSNLAYTTTARHHHHNHREAVATSDAVHLKKQLSLSLQSVEAYKPILSTSKTPIIFAFTGQGSSYPSMNLELFSHFRSQLVHLDSLSPNQGLVLSSPLSMAVTYNFMRIRQQPHSLVLFASRSP